MRAAARRMLVPEMPSSICYHLRPVRSSPPSLLLALQGSQGACMNSAGETFPSRPKGWSGRTLPLSWDAQLHNRFPSITPRKPLLTPSLYHPAPTDMACPIWGHPDSPSSGGCRDWQPLSPVLDECCPPCSWLGTAWRTLSTSILLAGTHLLRLLPSPSPLWYMAFLRVFTPAKGTSESEARAGNGQKAISNGTETTPGPDGDQRPPVSCPQADPGSIAALHLLHPH